MKPSARNVLPAKIKSVVPGAVDSEVVLALAPVNAIAAAALCHR